MKAEPKELNQFVDIYLTSAFFCDICEGQDIPLASVGHLTERDILLCAVCLLSIVEQLECPKNA